MLMIEKLENLMNERGLSKADLSRNTGLPYTTVDGFWKQGTSNIKRSNLLKLARYFDCTLDYLADDDIDADDNFFKNRAVFIGVSNEYTAKERQLIEKYRALDDRGRLTVDATIETQYEIITTQSKKPPE